MLETTSAPHPEVTLSGELTWSPCAVCPMMMQVLLPVLLLPATATGPGVAHRAAICFAPGASARASAPLCRVVHYQREEGDAAPIDVRLVEELLFQRSQLRQDRDFEGADAIYNRLARMGVTVYDREMKWFVGRGGGHSFRYRREEDDSAAVDVARVEELLARRSARRKERNFAAADDLREQLSSMGVSVRDKELTWRVTRGVGSRVDKWSGRGGDSRGGGRDSDRGADDNGRRVGYLVDRRPAEGRDGSGRGDGWGGGAWDGGGGRPAPSGGKRYNPSAPAEQRARDGRRERQASWRGSKAQK